jgi:DNA-directed RNA polymerase specialized sigma24 family protein
LSSKELVVELIRRYSNNPALLDDLHNARQAAMSADVDDEPELGGEHRAVSQGGWRVTDRLAADGLREVVTCYRAGMTARELAEKFSISPSSVKRILRRAGARKRRKPPG